MSKYDPPYVKKPIPKKYSGKAANPEEAALGSANKILTFGSMPSYRSVKYYISLKIILNEICVRFFFTNILKPIVITWI